MRVITKATTRPGRAYMRRALDAKRALHGLGLSRLEKGKKKKEKEDGQQREREETAPAAPRLHGER